MSTDSRTTSTEPVHAYWIHDQKVDYTSVTGYFYLPSCRCSHCGAKSKFEHEICSTCGAVMDGTHE